jgi:hypothetical protein
MMQQMGFYTTDVGYNKAEEDYYYTSMQSFAIRFPKIQENELRE